MVGLSTGPAVEKEVGLAGGDDVVGLSTGLAVGFKVEVAVGDDVIGLAVGLVVVGTSGCLSTAMSR